MSRGLCYLSLAIPKPLTSSPTCAMFPSAFRASRALSGHRTRCSSAGFSTGWKTLLQRVRPSRSAILNSLSAPSNEVLSPPPPPMWGWGGGDAGQTGLATLASVLAPRRWLCRECGRPAVASVTIHDVAAQTNTARIIWDCGHPELGVLIKREK